MAEATLNSITYPTGGTTTFNYEAHTFKSVAPTAYSNHCLVNPASGNNGSCNYPQSSNCNRPLSLTGTHLNIPAGLDISRLKFQIYMDTWDAATVQNGATFTLTVKKNGTQIFSGYFGIPAGSSQATQTLNFASFFGLTSVSSSDIFDFQMTKSGGGASFMSLDIYYNDVSNLTQNVVAGGLRIKSIVNSDGVNTAANVVKNYSYQGADGFSSGLLVARPNFMTNLFGYGLTFIPPGSSSVCAAGFSLVKSNIAGPYLNTLSGNLGYQIVTVSETNNGYSQYKYNISGVPPYLYNQNAGYNIDNIDSWPQLPEYNASGFLNGYLVSEKHFDASNNLKSEIDYNYVGVGVGSIACRTVGLIPLAGCVSQNGGPSNPAGTITHAKDYSISYYRVYLNSKTQSIDGISTQETYTYNSAWKHHYPIVTSFVRSDGKTYQSKSYYPSDISGTADHPSYSVLKTMETNYYMVGIPAKTELWVNGALKKAHRAQFSMFNGYPYSQTSDEMNRDGSWDTKLTINGYTSAGLIAQTTKKGYTTSEQYAYFPSNLLKSKSFGPLVTNYTYRVNTDYPETVTDENGQKKQFIYDGLMRLGLTSLRFDATGVYPHQTVNYNYNYNSNPAAYGSFTNTSVSYLDQSGVFSTTQYIDGLGRLAETTRDAYTPGGFTQKSFMSYDANGREDKVYQPFQSANVGYEIYNLSTPYSYTQYELSPLNRPWKLYALDGRYIEIQYATNGVNEVRKITSVSGSVVAVNGFYDTNTLIKTVTIDENSHKTETFKDNTGTIVLTRRYTTDPVSGQLQKADTYDVFDDYDMLAKTIPPGALIESAPGNLSASSASITESLCYNYEYDNLSRLSRKKIPGADWKLYYYNSRDLPTFTQDANMRALNAGKMLASLYDGLGRPIKTGIIYVGVSDPASVASIALTSDASGFTLDSVYTISVYDPAKNRLTQTSTRVLGNFSGADVEWLTKNYTYDDFNQVTGITGNNVWNKIETTAITYNDAGLPLIKTYTHTSLYGSQNGFRTTNEYDKSLRLKNEYHETMDYTGHYMPKIQVSERNYNHLDQVLEKNIGWVNNRFLQSIDYTYTVRGWLASINSGWSNNSFNAPLRKTDSQYGVSNSGGTNANTSLYNEYNLDLFGETLQYDSPVAANSVPQYNGNISEVSWKIADKDGMDYAYKYDELDRLTNAQYSDITGQVNLSVSNKYDESASYDLRGNIQRLVRRGLVQTQNCSNYVCGIFGEIDNLTYNYDAANANTLKGVKDAAAGPAGPVRGFRFNGNGTSDYAYDPNGNLLTDANKGITNIQYNYLNLPVRISFAPGNYIEFLYDANGKKLRKNVVQGWNNVNRMDYFDGIEYQNWNPTRIPHQEGQVRKQTDGSWQYEWVLKDHLGATRVTFTNAANDGAVGYSDIKQVNHYYPFGLNMEGPWNGAQGPNAYQYTGTEWNNDFNLGWYDYGFRFYDPAIGRFWNIDPLAETNEDFTPYAYADNNPVNLIDYMGLSAEDPAAHVDLHEVVVTAKRIENKTIKRVQQALDVASWVPGIGTAASLINAGIDVYNGDYKSALLNAASAIPIGGALVKIGKLALVAGKVAKELKIVEAAIPLSLKGINAIKAASILVYHSIDPAGKTIYVGITNSFARRAKEHLAKKGIDIEILLSGLSKDDAQAVEQALIEIHGLSKNGGSLTNKINSLSPTKAAYASQVQKGYDLLKSIGYK